MSTSDSRCRPMAINDGCFIADLCVFDHNCPSYGACIQVDDGRTVGGEVVPVEPVLSGTVDDRASVDVTGLDATGLTVGPDEVLVLTAPDWIPQHELASHREGIETALPPDRYLILQGWKLTKVSLEVAAQWRAIEQGAG